MSIRTSIKELAEAIYLAHAEVPDPQDGIAPARDPNVKLDAFDDLDEETQTGFTIVATHLLTRFNVSEKKSAGDYDGRPIEQDINQILLDSAVKRIWLHPDALTSLKQSEYFDPLASTILPNRKGSYLGVPIYENTTNTQPSIAEYSRQTVDGSTPVRIRTVLSNTFPIKVIP